MFLVTFGQIVRQ